MLIELTPGTIADFFITGQMSQEDIAELRAMFNLDKSMLYRYGDYMLNLVQGNLGVSYATGMNVFDMYMQRLPNTLVLSLAAVVLGVSISIPMGILAARRAGTIVDAGTTTLSLAGVSMPSFWLGLLLILLFSFQFKWLPAGGNENGIRSLILPGICSAMTLMATSTRQTRSSMLEVLKADFLRTARAKGVPEKKVIRKHALGNALIPIVTAVGASICVQLAGSVVIEQVFAWPGVGRMLVEGMVSRDTPVIIGCSIMTTILYVLVMLIVDLLYAFIDPRIKSQYMRNKRIRKAASTALPETEAQDALPATVAAGAWDVESLSDDACFQEEASLTPVGWSIQNDGFQDDRQSDLSDTSYSGARDCITRLDGDIATKDTTYSAIEIFAKYKKRSQFGEIWHRLVRNKSSMAGILILGLVFVVAIGSLFMSYESIVSTNIPASFSAPSWQFPFGADNMGRNLLLRVLYGSRYSIVVGFCSVIFSAIFGIIMGSVAAYYGGKTDNVIMRISDVLASLPAHLLGMVIMVMLGRSMQNLIIAVGIAGIPHFIRITRASILTVKDNEYVEAARAIGFSNVRIIGTQILPNGLSPILVQVTALLGLNIIFAAALSFLGFGIPPPTPEWGALVSAGRDYVRTAPWLAAFPGLAIMVTVLGFNLLGDGLRDALDPKLKR